MWYNNNTYFKFIPAESGTYKLTFINIYRATSQATYYDVIFDKPLQSTEGASEPSILTIDPIDDITMNSLNGSLPRVTIRDENGDIVTGKTKTYTCEALSEYGASINSSDRYIQLGSGTPAGTYTVVDRKRISSQRQKDAGLPC
jgi:hypothetical protein